MPTDANTVFRGADLSMVQSAFRAALAKQPTTAAARGTQSATHVGGPHPQTEDFNTALEAVSTGQPIPATMSDGQIIDQCAKLGAELAWAKVTGNQAHAAQLETALAFGTCDPLWTEVAVEYEAFKLSKQPIPYRGYGGDLSKFVLPLPAGDANGIRIGIFADWGTGTSDAVNLLTAILAQSPHVLIHLGDIYYSGTQDEMNGNFLAVLKKAGVTIPVFTLTGNHDMYSGGAGYYWLIDQLGQPASYFCLRNDSWQFLAMDTAFNDSNPGNVDTNVTSLQPAEAAWHLDKLANAGGRKTVLLSHHQLFTFAETCGALNGKFLSVNPNLQATFGPAIANGQVAYWFWGHEHNFIAYQPFLGLNLSACLGAGALPVFVGDEPYAPEPKLAGQTLPTYFPQLVLQNDGTIYNHCFGIITLRGAAGTVDYYQVGAAGPALPGNFSQAF